MTAMILRQPQSIDCCDSQIQIKDSPYVARLIANDESALLYKCYGLRYQYFVEQRRWVAANHLRSEDDRYDAYALHLAVFQENEIAAYLRILPYFSEIGFMLDHEFRCLAPNQGLELYRSKTAELSRLVVSDWLSVDEKIRVTELLFKLFYQTALQHKYEHFYIVVEPCWLRLCKQRFGFAFRPIGPVHTFPDGTRTVAAYASLHDLERSMQEHSMEKFRWYATLEPVSADVASMNVE